MELVFVNVVDNLVIVVILFVIMFNWIFCVSVFRCLSFFCFRMLKVISILLMLFLVIIVLVLLIFW